MKRVAVLQSNYIPWKGYFDIIAAVDEFIVYDCVQYTKNDWRNRNQIKTPQGKTWLTVPVRQHHLAQTIEETQIADRTCFARHWRTFRHAYAKAPHLGYCTDLLEDLFLDPQPPELLGMSNVRLLRRIAEGLDIRTPIRDANAYAPSGDRNERLLDLCVKAGATTYLSGPAAAAYLDTERFASAGITVEWADYDGYREYPQPYPPFDHFVSILDLLAATGPDAKSYLRYAGGSAATQSAAAGYARVGEPASD
jgi:WbqC-like protein family